MPRPFLCAAVLALASVSLNSSAEVVTTIGAPMTEIRPGADTTVTLFFLNTSTAQAAVDAPAELPARLSAGDRVVNVTLRRVGPAPASPIAVGQFARADYLLTPPAGFTGAVALDVRKPGGEVMARSSIAIAAPPPVVGAGAAKPVVAAAPAGEAANKPAVPRGDSGIAEAILPRFSAHEPIYFVAGADQPNAKFQVSFKYQLFNPEGPWAQAFWPIAGFHVAYTQTSLWDLEGDSSPFFDSSYKPELLWSAPDLRFENSIVSRLGVQVGYQHESNGRGGVDSRSVNVLYVRPSITFGDPDGLFLTVAPRLAAYVSSLSDNPDIKDYRGFGDIRVIAGHRTGFQAAFTARIGDDWDKGSIQADLSYPLRDLLGGNVDLYLYGQYFNGFGESLLEYNESTQQFRLGVGIVR